MGKKDEPSIGDTIKEALKDQPLAPPQGAATRGDEGGGDDPGGVEGMAKAATWGDFKVKIGVSPPDRSGGKYDWASFPAPADAKDPKTWPSVLISTVTTSKTIYSSIKSYRDKLQKAGTKNPPEFSVSVEKDPKNKDKVLGIRVTRKS